MGITNRGKYGLQIGAGQKITNRCKKITNRGRDYKSGQKDYKSGQGLQNGAGITNRCSTITPNICFVKKEREFRMKKIYTILTRRKKSSDKKRKI